jgi:hypothetical protein
VLFQIVLLEATMNIFWTLGANGDFATASNWTPATVPGPADDAIIIGLPANYTVTSSADETIDTLIIANAALLVSGGTFTTTNGGFNAGTIIVDGALDVGTTGENTRLTNIGQVNLNPGGEFVVAGDLSLQGHGQVALANNFGFGIVGNGSPATLYTDNFISGRGIIGGTGFTLVNEAGGVINGPTIEGGTVVENSGILENLATQEFSGPVVINNAMSGVLKNVKLVDDVTVVGGTLETSANAVTEIVFDGNVLEAHNLTTQSIL